MKQNNLALANTLSERLTTLKEFNNKYWTKDRKFNLTMNFGTSDQIHAVLLDGEHAKLSIDAQIADVTARLKALGVEVD